MSAFQNAVKQNIYLLPTFPHDENNQECLYFLKVIKYKSKKTTIKSFDIGVKTLGRMAYFLPKIIWSIWVNWFRPFR